MTLGMLLQMSATGGIMVAAIMTVRPLMKRWRTHGFQMFLWYAALLMFLIPLRPSSPISVYNAAQNLPAIAQLLHGDNEMAGAVSEGGIRPLESLHGEPVKANRSAADLIAPIWLVGAGLMLCGGIATFIQLRWKFRGAVPRKDVPTTTMGLRRKVYICSSARIKSPITYGIFRPRIILPMNLAEDAALDYMLRHEIRHIRNFDALLNGLWLSALCIHWFNPLVWIGWIWLRRDMETRCDAQVVAQIGLPHRADYAQTLLSMACIQHEGILPTAFGTPSISDRIKRILSYRPVTKIARLASMTLALALLMAFATNPIQTVIMAHVEAADAPILSLSTKASDGTDCAYVLYQVVFLEPTADDRIGKRYVLEKTFTTRAALQSYMADAYGNNQAENLLQKLTTEPLLGFGFGLGDETFSVCGLPFGVFSEPNPSYYVLIDKETLNFVDDAMSEARALRYLGGTTFTCGSSDEIYANGTQILWLARMQ